MENLEKIDVVQLLERLHKKKQAERGFIAKIARDTQISQENLYKWAALKATPGYLDAVKVKQYLDKVESVPQVEEPQPQYGSMVVSVSERIAELQHDKKVLQDTIAANLKTIHASQDVLMLLVRSVYDQTGEIKRLLEAPQKPGKDNMEGPVLTAGAKGRKN